MAISPKWEVPQMGACGTGESGHPKWSLKVSKIKVRGIKGDPFQQIRSQQFPPDRGPAAGAKP